MNFIELLQSDEIFTPATLPLDCIKPLADTDSKYIQLPVAFDIETTSMYVEGEKFAFMYIWQMCIGGICVVGRTWDEFLETLDKLCKAFSVSDKKRLCIYVHNLSFEFQFMRKYFTWAKVFAIKSRTPIYAITDNGIEFRCSYYLSGLSLDKTAKNITLLKIRKLTGDLDYSKIRTNVTPLTDKEIQYCVYDVKIVVAYIIEQMQRYKSIGKIPKTSTGVVRRFCYNACFYGLNGNEKSHYGQYRRYISKLILGVDEYKQLKRAFMGGFVHSSARQTNRIITNVASYDITSSYPTVMIADQFPCSAGELITDKADIQKSMKTHCCVFDIAIYNIRQKFFPEQYLSVSRCFNIQNAVVSNGRIVSADYLETTITNIDFDIIQKVYACDKIEIANFRRYKKGYLPTNFVKAILKLYENKTILKGIQGMESEYLLYKAMLNSCYGMSVTDIVRPIYEYSNESGQWADEKEPDFEDSISRYNADKNRFLFYAWGVFVTAYARRNLWRAIFNIERDYIYADTDSCKFINHEKHKQFFECYNQYIQQQVETALKWHGIDVEKAKPKTKDGVNKPLGVWDFEGIYTKFKTCGAKRYMTEKDGKLDITVAGLPKEAISYIQEKGGFSEFKNNMAVPANRTGKKTHTYIDDEKEYTVIDYLGNECKVHSLSGIHLENAAFKMNMGDYEYYIETLMGIDSI